MPMPSTDHATAPIAYVPIYETKFQCTMSDYNAVWTQLNYYEERAITFNQFLSPASPRYLHILLLM